MNFTVALTAMALTTYLIRALPLTLFRKRIESRFLRSFLYYVPPACLTAMTVPAIFGATEHPVSGAVGLLAAAAASCLRWKLPAVAAVSCVAVLVSEGICRLG